MDNLASAAVTSANPDHLRRRAAQKTPLMEIGILRRNYVSRRLGVVPDFLVGDLLESTRTNVNRTGEEIRKEIDETWRDVIVEK